jgi:TolB-like protein/Tfp pilus assembly protein PilF
LGRDTGAQDADATKAELFDAVSHPVRIKILEALNEKPMGFAELGRVVGIESGGHLSFHLTKLGHLIRTNSQGDYVLTGDGRDALWTVHSPGERSPALEATPSQAHRIAVLPLSNLGPDPKDEYFADGMTEEIISAVSGISNLDVISRTSVMGYKGTTKKVEEIGRDLKVGSVLEGSFRKVGKRIRVTVQLIEVPRDRHLWGQNYDRSLGGIFSVQSDVAKQVADALRVEILSLEMKRIEKKPSESVEAHTLYLKGIYHLMSRPTSQVDLVGKAIEYFKLACEQDPRFALAYAKLAECELLLGDETMPSREAVPKAKEHTARALSLDDELAEAHLVHAMIANQYDWDWIEAEKSFRKSLSLNPSLADAHTMFSWFLAMMGRSKEAISEAKRACELDPMSSFTHQLGGFSNWIAGDYRGARVMEMRSLELSPSNAYAHMNLGMISATEGKFEDAVKEADEALKLADDTSLRSSQALAYAQAGLKEKARKILDGVKSNKYSGYPSPALNGTAYYLLGEKDEGWKWMQDAYEARDSHLVMFNRNPTMWAAREDPRFLGLLKRLGLDSAAGKLEHLR